MACLFFCASLFKSYEPEALSSCSNALDTWLTTPVPKMICSFRFDDANDAIEFFDRGSLHFSRSMGVIRRRVIQCVWEEMFSEPPQSERMSFANC